MVIFFHHDYEVGYTSYVVHIFK